VTTPGCVGENPIEECRTSIDFNQPRPSQWQNNRLKQVSGTSWPRKVLGIRTARSFRPIRHIAEKGASVRARTRCHSKLGNVDFGDAPPISHVQRPLARWDGEERLVNGERKSPHPRGRLTGTYRFPLTMFHTSHVPQEGVGPRPVLAGERGSLMENGWYESTSVGSFRSQSGRRTTPPGPRSWERHWMAGACPRTQCECREALSKSKKTSSPALSKSISSSNT
jgi:hypothetical protein